MNDTSSSCIGRIVSHIALAVAYGSLATACSGRYPLGDTSEVEGSLAPDDSSGALAPRDSFDTRVPAVLGPPDVTINGELGGLNASTLASVGDLDGDGSDEMAVVGTDSASGFAFVHLRYGGPRPLGPEGAFAFERSGAYLVLPSIDSYSLTVVGAGDVDGDGYGDLLLDSAECYTEGHDGTYLIYGGPERLEGSLALTSLATRFVPSARVPYPVPPGYGISCSGAVQAVHAGDLDGDGVDDIVLTRAPQEDTSNGSWIFGTGEGVYVFYGRRQRFSGEVPLTTADATFHIAEYMSTFALGDIDGDGRADLLVSPDAYQAPPPGSYLLSGRAKRWRGPLELATNAKVLAGAYATTSGSLQKPGDLDGDGRDDVLLWDKEMNRHLFYGAPGLFDDGLDFAAADAFIPVYTTGYVFSAGDRDGDGDDELLAEFEGSQEHLGILSSNVALTSGSPERVSGTLVFPTAEVLAREPEGPFPGQGRTNFLRALDWTIPAGDLDGDGAADLFTTSSIYEIEEGETPTSVGYTTSDPQVHIHYGTPARRTFDVR